MPNAKTVTRYLLFAIVSALVAIGLTVLSRGKLQAQGSTITIKPSTYSNVGMTNPANAYDGSTTSAAFAHYFFRCVDQCQTPSSATATWSGVPNGYHPIRLEVQWDIDGSFTLFSGDTARLEFKVEYSLDGGGTWSTSFDGENTDYIYTTSIPACSGNNIRCSGGHISTLALSDFQSTGNIQVRGSFTAQMTNCVNCTRVSGVSGTIYVRDIRVVVDDCQIPVNESSASAGWNTTTPYRTTHRFTQTLTPAGTNNFYGRLIQEADGGGTTDGCWFSGSSIAQVTSVVSGGSWTVDTASNTWGSASDADPYDNVGWLEGAASYYQANSQNGLPCYASGLQIMKISCQNGSNFVPYIANTLEDGINTATVSSQRQSTYVERAWP